MICSSYVKMQHVFVIVDILIIIFLNIFYKAYWILLHK